MQVGRQITQNTSANVINPLSAKYVVYVKSLCVSELAGIFLWKKFCAQNSAHLPNSLGTVCQVVF